MALDIRCYLVENYQQVRLTQATHRTRSYLESKTLEQHEDSEDNHYRQREG